MKHNILILLALFLGLNMSQGQNLRFSNLENVENGKFTVWFYVENNSSTQSEILQAFNLRYYYQSKDLEFVDFKLEKALLDAGFIQFGGKGDNLFVESDVSRSGSADRYVGYAPFVMDGGVDLAPRSGDQRALIHLATLQFRMKAEKEVGELQAFQVGAKSFMALTYTGLPGCQKGCGVVLVEPPKADATQVVTDFTGFKLGLYDTKLVWETKGEALVDQYVVERRQAGLDNWEDIAYVPVETITEGSRTYTDAGVYDGIQNKAVYEYRIALQYRDSGKSLTQIETIAFERLKSIIDVYPNPSSREMNVQLDPVVTEEDCNLLLYDSVGRLIFSRDVAKDSKYEHIDLQNLSAASGSYTLQLWSAKQLLDHHQVEVVR